jgi:hypothetical protein
MASYHCAGFIGHLAVRDCACSRQFHFSAARGSYVFFAKLESVPEHESQHRLRCAPGFAGELLQAALLRFGECWLMHAGYSFR